MSKEETLNSLLEMGQQGHFPIIPQDWIYEALLNPKSTRKNDRIFFENVLERLSKHRTLERKSTVLMALSEKERNAFIKCLYEKLEYRLSKIEKIVH